MHMRVHVPAMECRAAWEVRCFGLQSSSCVFGGTREQRREFLQRGVGRPASRAVFSLATETFVGEGENEVAGCRQDKAILLCTPEKPCSSRVLSGALAALWPRT
jgi:hypothetical protein